MTQISATLVKELRERTGAGMMECKKALTETQGNIDEAIDFLRKSGQLKADKKTDRVTAEGIIVAQISHDNKHGIMIEINCETDFVARDQNFLNFANEVAKQAIAHKAQDIEALLVLKLPTGETVEEARRALIAKIGENIQVRRYVTLNSTHHVANYVHGGRIGTLVAFEGNQTDLAKDLAMHIVATNPMVVSPEQVPDSVIAKEKEIFSAQALNSGKPANIVEKMVEGRVKKFLEEITLIGQPFVKNSDITVGKLLSDANAKVQSFVRLAVGEGVEKKVEDFAAEVMAQVRGS